MADAAGTGAGGAGGAGGHDGKVAIISGGSAGIGKAVAAKLAGEGAQVVLLARRRDRLEDAAADIGPAAIPVVADIGDPGSVRAAFDEVERRFGRVDALLNVAGAARARLIEETSDEDIAAVVGTNFLGPIYTTRAAIPLLRKAGGGDIVNVSSEITLDDMPLMTLYSSTKRALEAFTKTMTRSCAPTASGSPWSSWGRWRGPRSATTSRRRMLNGPSPCGRRTAT
jgi:NAD(P)-dependent dehydrogenase (short-subunit alcohol dehydrogenase family)